MQVGTPPGECLEELASSGKWNLRRLSGSALASTFLPALIPSAWHGRERVMWAPGMTGHPSTEWMAALWGVLGGLPDLAALSVWPLLPVKGALVRALPSSQVWTCASRDTLLVANHYCLRHSLPLKICVSSCILERPSFSHTLLSLFFHCVCVCICLSVCAFCTCTRAH
jgi:hypothetical protein